MRRRDEKDLRHVSAAARCHDKRACARGLAGRAAARFDVVTRLLARKVDINARYPNDLTLLMWACGPDEAAPEAQAIKIVQQLLDAGAHIDDRDARGRTALMIAAEQGHTAVVEALLRRGADHTLRDKAGKRALDLTAHASVRELLSAR